MYSHFPRLFGAPAASLFCLCVCVLCVIIIIISPYFIYFCIFNFARSFCTQRWAPDRFLVRSVEGAASGARAHVVCRRKKVTTYKTVDIIFCGICFEHATVCCGYVLKCSRKRILYWRVHNLYT